MIPPRSTSRSGFTLVEMTIVIVVMAIMAALALPRLTSNRDREFQLVADQVADLLMMFAQRESLGTKPVGLWEDTVNRQLALTVLDIPDRSTDSRSNWIIDRLVRPVKLPADMSFLDIQLDGDSADISQWPVHTQPGKNRPVIAVMLEGPTGIFTIALPPHALTPVKIRGEAYMEYLGGPIDLDAAGQDREDW